MNRDAATAEQGKRRELALAVFLVLFGLGIVAQARTIPLGVQTDPLGPRFLPHWLGVAVATCGALLAAGALLGPGWMRGLNAPLMADAGDDEESETSGGSRLRVIGAIAATGLYLAAFERVGYVLATPAYLAAIMLIHGGPERRSLLVAPLIATAVLYVSFRFGLLIPVPDGVLENLLRR